MEQKTTLISAGEAMKRLGLTDTKKLQRLVRRGQLTRIYNDQRTRRGLYIEEEVNELARQWREFDKRYIIVA